MVGHIINTVQPEIIRVWKKGLSSTLVTRAAQAIAPEVGEEEHKEPHIGGLQQCVPKDSVGHGRESSALERHIVDLHAVGHGDGHDEAEYDTLQFGFRHTNNSFPK